MELTSNNRHSSLQEIARLCAVAMTCLLSACANMGAGPQGGEKDVTPPKYMGSTPKPNETNYNNKKITLTFDEYVQLKDAYNQVVVSPPQQTPISISALGKKVTVELLDSLIPDRTYIIDFANSIADNNEGNELENYFISFSTGNEVDSFAISGTVIDAMTLAPMKGIYVGAYESDADSAFKKCIMDYVAKTNNNGEFTIHGLKERNYNIYALKDNNSNFRFDDKSEGIAVLGHAVKTARLETIKRDTVYKDSTTIDTIITKKASRFVPDSLLMRYYVEEHHQQFYKNATWNNKEYFVLNFVNEKKQLPKITPLNFKSENWYKVEPSVTFDTLTYWLNDTLVEKLDTIRFAIDYEKTDSLENFIAQRDTINLYAKKWKKDKKYQGPEFDIKKVAEIYESPKITWTSPLKSFSKKDVALLQKSDSTWEDVDFDIEAIENKPREFKIVAKLNEDAIYKVKVDSGNVADFAGVANKVKLEKTFKTKSKKDYVKLDLNIKNAKTPAIVELLNSSDKVLRQVKIENGNKATFENLAGGDYYIRLIEDKNNDGKWTTGNYDQKVQPEMTYYYPSKITLRANWDREEDWDILVKPITEQRPSEMVVNEKKSKKR